MMVGTFTSQIFSPPKITGLALWLDAADTRTITATSNLVTQWNDKSSNQFNVSQGNTSFSPVTGSTTRNTQNVLTFNGTNTVLLNNSNSLFQNVSGFAFYAVVNTTNTTAGRILHKEAAPGNVINRAGLISRIGVTKYEGLARRVSTDAASRVASTTDSTTAWAIVGQIVNFLAGTHVIRVNRVAENSTTTTVGTGENTPGGIFAVGANTNSTQYFPGNIGEAIGYSKTLSNDEITLLESYFSRKWAI